MARHGLLDASDPPQAEPVKFLSLLLVAAIACSGVAAQPQQQSDSQRLELVRKAYDAKQFDEAARLAEGSPGQSAELDYWDGMALAHLQRWVEARNAFTAGHAKSPHDPKFLTERAGSEYRLNHFSNAKDDLRKALRLDPNDAYAREFLGTLYLLESNIEAALKYWNPLEKPRLASVRLEPSTSLNARLQERATTFRAPATLERNDYMRTNALFENLAVFSSWRTELAPTANDDAYSATIRFSERSNWGSSWLGTGVALASGLPYETIYPEFHNLGGEAVNIESLARWDSEKRRYAAEVSAPLFRNPARRVSLFFDARNENWNLSRSFLGAPTPITDLNLRRFAGGARIRVVQSGLWSWTAGVQIVSREFRNVPAVVAPEAAPFFTNSASFEAWLQFDRSLLRVPERRFTLDATAAAHVGRGFADALGPFGSLGAGLKAHWLPQARGDDYEFIMQLRAANTFGDVPLDQLFELGLDRDNDLWLRGHRAFIDGRKGGAPLGRRYALLNSEFSKIVYNHPLFRVQFGPFLDSGATADPSGLFGSQGWQTDAGAQMKVRVLADVTLVLSYGWDLRRGSGTFFGTAVP